MYSDWKIIYEPDAYVIPGLTDLNVRASSECEECISKAAFMGGITNVFVEVTTQTVFSLPNLYPLQVISHIDELYHCPSIVKIYLSQPDCYTPNTDDSAEIILEANNLDKVVIVDCSVNDPRLLAMASPFRTAPVTIRLVGKLTPQKIFGSAIDITITDPISSDEEESEELQIDPEDNFLIDAELRTYKTSGKTVYKRLEIPRQKRPQALVIPTSKQDLGYDEYLHHIPRSWELKGVKQVLENLIETSRIHFSNISCAETIQYLDKNTTHLPYVTWETSPNYIFFNENDLGMNNTCLKTYPPIRDKRNQEALCKLFCQKKIHCIGSHHNYIKPEYKIKEFSRAVPGICSLGYGLSALWTKLFNQNDQILEQVIKTMSINPAKIAKLETEIYVGGKATFVLWSPGEERKSFFYDNSPYNKKNLKGEVLYVFMNGDVVYSSRSDSLVF